MLWILWPYPEIIHHSGGESYILHISLGAIAKIFIGFYGLYVLPGLIVFYIWGKSLRYNPFLSFQRVFFAFLWGMVAHLIAAFFQKYFRLPYGLWTVISLLVLSYIFLGFISRPIKDLLQEEKPVRRYDLLTVTVLLIGFSLGLAAVKNNPSGVALIEVEEELHRPG